MLNFKFIWSFLRWLMNLSESKTTIVICLLVMGVQFYIIKVQGKQLEVNNKKLSYCQNKIAYEEKWWAIRSDSLVNAKAAKYEDLLLKIIDKADKSEKDQKETNKITQQTIKNLSKK